MKKTINYLLSLLLITATAQASPLDQHYKNEIDVSGMPVGTGMVTAWKTGSIGMTLKPGEEAIRINFPRFDDGYITINGLGQKMELPKSCLVTVFNGGILYFRGKITPGQPVKPDSLYCVLAAQP